MSAAASRVVDWLDDVLAWLREPLVAMPVDLVLARLRSTFTVNSSTWSAQDGLTMTTMVFDPPGVMDSHSAILAEFMAGQHRDCHSLSVWYARTPSLAPQTLERVPTGLVPTHRRRVLAGPLTDLGLDQQMTLYYRRAGLGGHFFALGRDRRDFDDEDLAVARYVQRSLITLDRQTQALAGRVNPDLDPEDLGLTGRELAVLQLLSDGLSTRRTARRLACSPRTVEKHLQRTYRKLGVRDRVNALRVARLAGAVVEVSTAPGSPSLTSAPDAATLS